MPEHHLLLRAATVLTLSFENDVERFYRRVYFLNLIKNFTHTQLKFIIDVGKTTDPQGLLEMVKDRPNISIQHLTIKEPV